MRIEKQFYHANVIIRIRVELRMKGGMANYPIQIRGNLQRFMTEIKKPSDICTHLGDDYDKFLGAIVPPLFQNTLFTRKNENYGYEYTRISNPTIDILEQKLASLEHAEAARAFSSGMGAITAVLTSLLKAGDHAVVLRCAYYPVSRFFIEELNRFGVTVDFVENGTPEEYDAAIKSNTKLIYMETPSSNIFKIQDIRGIVAVAKKHGIVTIIDNTCATSLYQNPLDLGVDYVIHSATKYLGGHSDIMGGVVMGNKQHMDKLKFGERAFFGACMDPFAAWLLIRSLRTLEVRVEKHSENAMAVAQYLEKNDHVKKVFYPGLASHEGYETAISQMSGFSGVMSVVLDTDDEHSMKFVKGLNVFEEGPSWGGFESIINTPGVFADKSVMDFECVPKGLIRLSIGLENVDSIISDLEQSLKKL